MRSAERDALTLCGYVTETDATHNADYLTALYNDFLSITENSPKPILTEDEVELLTTPLELAAYKSAITEAMFKGTARNIESEADQKNTGAE